MARVSCSTPCESASTRSPDGSPGPMSVGDSRANGRVSDDVDRNEDTGTPAGSEPGRWHGLDLQSHGTFVRVRPGVTPKEAGKGKSCAEPVRVHARSVAWWT